MTGQHPTPAPHENYGNQAAQHFARPAGTADPDRRWNIGRAVVATVLLVAALLLPWNIEFGLGVPDSAGWLFAVVVVVTVGACAAAFSDRLGPAAARRRLALAVPYLAVVAAFTGFAVVEAVRFGGTGEVPAGVGPGAIVGLGGALLAASPPLAGAEDENRYRPWFRIVKVTALVAMVLATLAVLFNLYWRTRFVLPNLGNAEYGSGNAVVVITTIAYGLVALVAVLVGLRWLLDPRPAARLAVAGLGVATVLGCVVVWTFSIGRDIDAFHGIAQTTSTAAVGFEGYLVWVGAAALLAPVTARRISTLPRDHDVWRDAIRKCLLLITIWFGGCALLRVLDVVTTASLGLPLTPYDSIGLLAFDLVAAAVAFWIRVNMGNPALHPVVVAALCSVLFVLSVCRVAVGVGLAPRILYTGGDDLETPVYGNSLAQQITSTFDVVMCGLALAVALVAVLVLRREEAPAAPERPAAPPTAAPSAQTQVIAGASAPTHQLAAPTQQLTPATDRIWAAPTQRGPSAPPRIARVTGEPPTQRVAAPDAATQQVPTADPATQQIPAADATQRLANTPPRIARLLAESTQRFAAGTTYTGTGRSQTPPKDENPS
ncbi:hypothetical protein [Mycolicibacterium sp.]|uniref:DUF7937 domain-containing protein n=1 Tax=Mycolicibacterium sp. TaxID=2320850 RepID=UPI003D0CDDAE